MDVINPDDINVYRNLAGGVTSAQILHGSANPIGGQSAIIKLKWGSEINDMYFEGAAPFIKFALGENVKQSNWSGSRFPQTRMGVEQVFVDHFDRAKEYAKTWSEYNSLSTRQKRSVTKPRFDDELETLWEILRGDRFVSSHSYVQSEINMLMKVAEKFNFRINTFTHILEGYKVADKMAEHGVGGSTFSDWWGYKYEVNDAIPYNASIMHNAGVTVALNSDNSELSRRLNLEAAKAVKYGDISEEEAWKFVTLNPAKLLHIDDKVADKMAEHGVGGSTFSDWWGYKYEVNDAIPYNASIMHNAGVTVALNSDNSELSRRLNLEAAKAVKYGDISEEEAWKFVTLNPAKLLHIDDKVGSLKIGKDADIVVWSGHPMSLFTKTEQTYIEGALYFDQDNHQQKLKEIKDEKSILIQQMLGENLPGVKLRFPNPMPQIEVTCEHTEF